MCKKPTLYIACWKAGPSSKNALTNFTHARSHLDNAWRCAKIAGSKHKHVIPLRGYFVRSLRELCVTPTAREQDANTASRYAAYYWNGTPYRDALRAIVGTKFVQVSGWFKLTHRQLFSARERWKVIYRIVACHVNIIYGWMQSPSHTGTKYLRCQP